jgi:hypothetical protein
MDEETTTSRDMFRIESLLPDTFDMTDEQPTSCRDSTQIANLLSNTLDIMEENSAASRVTPQVANLLPINLDITNKKATTTRDTSQLANLHPNTFYLTFNAPAKNEYVCLPHSPPQSSPSQLTVPPQHRGLFLTSTPPITTSRQRFDLPDVTTIPPPITGTLFHAVYTPTTGWALERREVVNIGESGSLVLLWRVGAMKRRNDDLGRGVDAVHELLRSLPCKRMDVEEGVGAGDGASFTGTAGTAGVVAGTTAGKRKLLSNDPARGGFDCIQWTERALQRLVDEGFVDVEGDVRDVCDRARASAGPEDARVMVGVEIGALRVKNDT